MDIWKVHIIINTPHFLWTSPTWSSLSSVMSTAFWRFRCRRSMLPSKVSRWLSGRFFRERSERWELLTKFASNWAAENHEDGLTNVVGVHVVEGAAENRLKNMDFPARRGGARGVPSARVTRQVWGSQPSMHIGTTMLEEFLVVTWYAST